MEQIKCGYIGCKQEAAYMLTAKYGKKQELNVCCNHAPSWLWTTKENETQYYTIQSLNY